MLDEAPMTVRLKLPPDHLHVAVVAIDRPAQANASSRRHCATPPPRGVAWRPIPRPLRGSDGHP